MKNAGDYEGYGALAYVYDRLNAEIDYEEWAKFCEEAFLRFGGKKPELVLDLACGTGSMTLALARRGYDMIGIDGSADMLSVAMDRAGEDGRYILFLQQDMRAFELYGTVGAITCCLDSINYLMKEEDVAATFAAAHLYLEPDGIFLFDVNTPYKFREVYGDNAYILEDERENSAVYCGWQNHFDPETGVCDFDLSLFEQDESGKYTRTDEHQTERVYGLFTIERLLTAAGFEFCGAYGGPDFSAPATDCERWYIAARCKK